MLEEFNKLEKRYVKAKFDFQYCDFVELLKRSYDTHPANNTLQDYYDKVWKRLTEFKADYFDLPTLKAFLCCLIFGLRFSEVTSFSWRLVKDFLIVNVTSLKGTQNRSLRYPLFSPLIKTLILLLPSPMPPLTYKNYYRSLLKANPNFYGRLKTEHLNATHIARHFFIHTLFFVLKVKKARLQEIMGWHRVDTIESYIDKDLFKSLNIGGSHGECDHKSDKTRRTAGSDHSVGNRIGTIAKKIIKKKIGNKKKRS